MLNLIWLAMLVVAVLVAGFTGRLPEVTGGAFEGARKAVMDVALPLLGIWAIWLGIMRLAERSGLVHVLASALRPLLRLLFPEVPVQHPAMGAMVMNMAANMLGLGNAATPLGLRAMRLLETLNPRPGVATNAMCTFLAINTASIQLLPLTAIGILTIAGAKGATAIVITSIVATTCAATSGVITAKLLERLPRFRVETGEPAGVLGVPISQEEGGSAEPAPASTANAADHPETESLPAAQRALTRRQLGGLGIYLAAFLLFFLILFTPGLLNTGLARVQGTVHRWVAWLPASIAAAPPWLVPAAPREFDGKPMLIRGLMSLSLLALPFLLSFFPLYAAMRGVKVYEEFVEGAKEAWDTARRTVPYLVAMLVAIGMLQKAGVMDLLTQALAPMLRRIGFPAELVPMVLMRPLSGSATNGLFVEIVQRLHEPDGFVSRLAGTIYGSTETTFYVVAIYFGSISIRRTRHAIAAGLTADTVAVVASTIICTLLFR